VYYQREKSFYAGIITALTNRSKFFTDREKASPFEWGRNQETQSRKNKKNRCNSLRNKIFAFWYPY
jgi:hypothetical protein